MMALMSRQRLSTLFLPFLILIGCFQSGFAENRCVMMFDRQQTIHQLQCHLKMLTEEIGERSVAVPRNLLKTREYITSFYRGNGIPVASETYAYRNLTVANVVAELAFGEHPQKRYVLGAHYDSVHGTVGADDNASAVAVQLETARQLSRIEKHRLKDVSIVFVSFALGAAFLGLWLNSIFVFPVAARVAYLGAAALVLIGLFSYLCLRPVLHPPSLEGMALKVEAAFPELENRLIAGLQLCRYLRDNPEGYSTDMIRAVINQADSKSARLNLRDIIDRNPVKKMGRVTGALVVLSLVFGLVFPGALRNSLYIFSY